MSDGIFNIRHFLPKGTQKNADFNVISGSFFRKGKNRRPIRYPFEKTRGHACQRPPLFLDRFQPNGLRLLGNRAIRFQFHREDEGGIALLEIVKKQNRTGSIRVDGAKSRIAQSQAHHHRQHCALGTGFDCIGHFHGFLYQLGQGNRLGIGHRLGFCAGHFDSRNQRRGIVRGRTLSASKEKEAGKQGKQSEEIFHEEGVLMKIKDPNHYRINQTQQCYFVLVQTPPIDQEDSTTFITSSSSLTEKVTSLPSSTSPATSARAS